jgi:Zn-dependent metalloprotease
VILALLIDRSLHNVLLALLVAASASFKSDFPAAKVKMDENGACIVSATSFNARGLGNTPEAAARAFLKRYAADFGITDDQKLLLQKSGSKGKLRFERQIDGDPVFDGDIEVTVNGADSVTRVKAEPVPKESQGSFKLNKQQAIDAAVAATSEVARESHPKAVKGWRLQGLELKRVWQVEMIAGTPPNEWREYIDAQDGSLLAREPVGQQTKLKKRDLAL